MPDQSKITVAYPYQVVATVTVDPDSVPGNTSSFETVTVKGLNDTQLIVADLPDLEAGLVLRSARVTADDTLTYEIVNVTGDAVNPASQTLKVVAL